MSGTEKLLRELIALPSVNPAFLPAGDPRAGEQRVAELLAATAARAGLEVEFLPVLPGRSNLLARLSPRGKARRRILLAPHLDTVNAAEAQFTPQIRSGRLFGRGACDTKGSVAAMLEYSFGLAQEAAAVASRGHGCRRLHTGRAVNRLVRHGRLETETRRNRNRVRWFGG